MAGTNRQTFTKESPSRIGADDYELSPEDLAFLDSFKQGQDERIQALIERVKQGGDAREQALIDLVQHYRFEDLERPGIWSRLTAWIEEWRFRRDEKAYMRLAEREQGAMKQERVNRYEVNRYEVKRREAQAREAEWLRYWSPD